MRPRLRHGQLDLALVARDRLDAHLDRVAEPVLPPRRTAGERRPEPVQLEVLAEQLVRRQEALEDVTEPREQTGADQADDLALPGVVPAQVEQLPLEQPGEADL